MLDGTYYSPQTAIDELKEVNNLLHLGPRVLNILGPRILNIVRFNGLQKLVRQQQQFAPPKELHAVELIAEFLFEESQQIRKYAAETLHQKRNLKESTNATLAFRREPSEYTLYHLFDEITDLMVDSDIEYSSFINQEGNFLGRYCITILSNLNKENIFPEDDFDYNLAQKTIFDKPLSDYLMEHQDGRIINRLKRFLKSDDPFLVRDAIKLIGVAGIVNLFNDLCEKLESNEYLIVNDVVQALTNLALQNDKMRNKALNCISNVCDCDELIKRYDSFAKANYTLQEVIRNLGHLRAYQQLDSIVQKYFLPEKRYTSRGKDKESLEYTKKTVIDALKELYIAELSTRGITSKQEVLDKILGYINDYSRVVMGAAIETLKELASEESIQYLMDAPSRDEHLRIPLAKFIGHLFEAPRGNEKDYSKEFPQLRDDAESRLKNWAALKDAKKELRDIVAKAMFQMNAQLSASELEALKRDEPSIESWYLYREPTEKLEQLVDDSEDLDLRFHAEMQLILRGERRWVSEEFAKQLSNRDQTTKLKVIPKLGEIEDDSATQALARLLNASSKEIAIAVRHSLKPYHCFRLAENWPKEFTAELYHKIQERVTPAYVNLLYAADEYRRRGQNLLYVLIEKQEEDQMRQSQESLIGLEHKRLFEEIIKPYKQEEANIISQNASEMYLEGTSTLTNRAVLAMASPEEERTNRAVLLARDPHDPDALNFLDNCLSDDEIIERIQSQISDENSDQDGVALVGRIVDKVENQFLADIGLDSLKACIPYDEVDFEPIGESETEKYIGNVICAKVMDIEDLRKQTNIDAIRLSRKEYLKSKALDDLENNIGAEIDVKITELDLDREELIVEHRGHEFTLTRDKITYSPLREWHEGLVVGASLKATVQKSANKVTLSLCPNKPIYTDSFGFSHDRDIIYLIAKYGGQEFKVAYIDGTKFELLDEPPGTYCTIPPGFLFTEGDGKDSDFLFPTQLVGKGDVLTIQFEVEYTAETDVNTNQTEYEIEGGDEEVSRSFYTQEHVLAVVKEIEHCKPSFERGQVIHGIVEAKSESRNNAILILDLKNQVPSAMIKGQLELPKSLADTYEIGDEITAKYVRYNEEPPTVQLKPISRLKKGETYPCLVSENSIGARALNVRSGPLGGQIPIDKISYSLGKKVVVDEFRRTLKTNRYHLDAMLEECETRETPIFPKQEVEQRILGEEFVGDIIDVQGKEYKVIRPDGNEDNLDLSPFSLHLQSLEPPKVGEQIEISQRANGDYLLKIHTAKGFTLLQNITMYEDSHTWLGNQPQHRVTYAGLKDGYHRFEIEPGKIFKVARNLVEPANDSLDITELEVGDLVLIRKVKRGIQIVERQPGSLKSLSLERKPIKCLVKSPLPSGDGVDLEICDDRYPLRPYISGVYKRSAMSDEDVAKFENDCFVGSETYVRIDKFGYDIDKETFDIEFSNAQIQTLDVRMLRERWENERPLFLDVRITEISQRKYKGRQVSDLSVKLEDYPNVSCIVWQQEVSWNLSFKRVLDKVSRMRQSGRKARARVEYVDTSKNEARLSLRYSEPVDFEQFLLNENPKGRISLAFIESNEEGELVFEFLPGVHFKIPQHLVRVQGGPFNINYLSHDVVEATVSATGLNILYLYRPHINEIQDVDYAFPGRYLEKRGSEWVIELSLKYANWICYLEPQEGMPEPQRGTWGLFTYAYTKGNKIYLRPATRSTSFLVWVTIDSVSRNGILVKCIESEEPEFIPEYELSWARRPLSCYSSFFQQGNQILCTRKYDHRNNQFTWSVKNNRRTYAHYFEQYSSRFLFKKNVLTYYGKSENSIWLEVEPGINVTIPISQFTYIPRVPLKQGDMLEVFIKRSKDETLSFSVTKNIIQSQTHHVEKGMLVARGDSIRYRREFHLRDYDYLFGIYQPKEQENVISTHQGQMLEVLETLPYHPWGANRCFYVGPPSPDSFMCLTKLLRIEEDKIVVTTQEEDSIEWCIENQEITYKIEDRDKIKQKLARREREVPFLCTVLDRSLRKLSLRLNPPLPFAWLENLGVNRPFELIFVEERWNDIIFEYSYGQKVAVPKILIERKNGEWIDYNRWERYKTGDLFLVDIVDLQRGQLKLKGLKVNCIIQSPLHKLTIGSQVHPFVQAPVKSVYPDKIVVDVYGIKVCLPKSNLLENCQTDVVSVFEEKQSKNEPICIEIIEVNKYGEVEAEQREAELSKNLKRGDIFEGKIVSCDGDAYYIEIPGNQQCSAILPVTELSWQYLTSDGETEGDERSNQPYSHFMEIGQSIRVQVTNRTEDSIYVSKASLMDPLISRSYPPIISAKDSNPIGCIIDGCVKQTAGRYILVEAYGMELLVEAEEAVWGTDDAPLKSGDFIEAKITHLDKQQRKLTLSIREANDAWTENIPEGGVDATIYGVCDDGLIVEYQGSLGFVKKSQLTWCPEKYIRSVFDIFQEGEQVRVFKTGQYKDVELSLKFRQMQLSRLSPGARIPKKQARVKSKVDDGIYVSIEGLIGFVPKESMDLELYQNLQNRQRVELELIEKDENFQIAQFQFVQEEEESLSVAADQNLFLFNFDLYYDYRLQDIFPELRTKVRSEEVPPFDWAFEEIRNRGIHCTHSNLKQFLNELHRQDVLDKFLDFARNYHQDESNDLLKRLLTGAKLYCGLTATDCADDYFIAGYINSLKGQSYESIKYWYEAYQLDSNSLDIILALADAYRKCEQHELHQALIDRYFHAIRLRNLLRLPEIYVETKMGSDFEYATEQFSRGNVREALSRFNTIVQRNLGQTVQEAALLKITLCHSVLGQYHQANATLEQISSRKNVELMSMDPYRDAYYLISLQVYFHLENLERFRKTLRDYINQCDKSPGAATWLSYILAFEGFYNQAYSIIEKVRSNPPEIAALKHFLAYKLQKELPSYLQSLPISESQPVNDIQFIQLLPKFNPENIEQFFQHCIEVGALEALEPMLLNYQATTPEVDIEYTKFCAKAEELMGNIDKAAKELKSLALKVIRSSLAEPEKLKVVEMVLQFMEDYSLHAEIDDFSKNQPIQDFCASHSAQSLFDNYSGDKSAPIAIISRLSNYWESLKKNPNGSNKVAGYVQNLCSHPRIQEILASEEGLPLREFLSQMSIRNPEIEPTQ